MEVRSAKKRKRGLEEEEKEEEEAPPTLGAYFSDLPVEIRALVYGELNNVERSLASMVCRIWRKEILILESGVCWKMYHCRLSSVLIYGVRCGSVSICRMAHEMGEKFCVRVPGRYDGMLCEAARLGKREFFMLAREFGANDFARARRTVFMLEPYVDGIGVIQTISIAVHWLSKFCVKCGAKKRKIEGFQCENCSNSWCDTCKSGNDIGKACDGTVSPEQSNCQYITKECNVCDVTMSQCFNCNRWLCDNCMAKCSGCELQTCGLCSIAGHCFRCYDTADGHGFWDDSDGEL